MEETVDRKAIITERIKSLESELSELSKYGDDVYANGTVIKFKYRFSGAAATQPWYTYYACKIKDGWYLTGRVSDRFTWDDLITFWNRGEVKKMRIATGWANL